MRQSPDQKKSFPSLSENITRRAFATSLGLGALALAGSAFNTEPDPSCYIRGSRGRRNPQVDITKIMECAANDPLVRINTAVVLGFTGVLTWIHHRRSH